MDVLVDALVTGLPLLPAFVGIYLVFVMRNDFDLTVEASFTMGGALTGVALLSAVPFPVAIAIGSLSAALMGCITASLHILLRIPTILAGLIMSIGFYSVNLRLLGSPSISLAETQTMFSWAQSFERHAADFATIAILVPFLLALLGLLGMFLLTDFGLALRSSGVNPTMARSQGVNDHSATIASLALANGLVGLSGSMVVQNQGFADINMGSGLLLAGIGGVLLGELLLRPTGSKVVRAMIAVATGTLLSRLTLAAALRVGLNASDLKAVTALVLIAVFIARVGARAAWQGRTTRDRRKLIAIAEGQSEAHRA